MARRANYGFDKRQKEIKRKQNADAKIERRRARLNEPVQVDEEANPELDQGRSNDTPQDGDAEPGREPSGPPEK